MQGNRERRKRKVEWHGLSGGRDKWSRLYKKWSAMKSRCSNPKNSRYHRYGGRGIKVCQEWMDSYPAFHEWAMSTGYKEGLTIDRKDNDGDYCPENCQWKTNKEQSRNKSTNHWITHNGVTKLMTEWSSDMGGSPSLVAARLLSGWTVQDAVTTPYIDHRKYIEFQGESLCARDWERKTGLPKDIIGKRLRKGWTVEQAITTPLGAVNRWNKQKAA